MTQKKSCIPLAPFNPSIKFQVLDDKAVIPTSVKSLFFINKYF